MNVFATATSIGSAATKAEWVPLPLLPDRLGVAGAFSGVSGGVLLVAGGANFPAAPPWQGGLKVWHDDVYALAGPDQPWLRAGKLPRPLGYGVCVTAPEGVVCIGGSDAASHRREVFVLGWRDGRLTIRPLPDLPFPLANGAGALAGRMIYLADGAEHPGEKAATNVFLALDLNSTHPEWKHLPPCPGRARILPVAAAVDQDFLLFGGAALEPVDGTVKRVYLRDAWRYHPPTGWRRLADLPQPCVAGPTPAPVVGETVLLAGGDDGSHVGFQPIDRHPGFTPNVLAYDGQRNAWSTNGTTPAPRATLPVTPWRGGFVFPSGELRPGVRSPEVWWLREQP